MHHLLHTLLFVLLGSVSSSAIACSLAEPPVEVVFDDSPPCVSVMLEYGQNLHVQNNCQATLFLTFPESKPGHGSESDGLEIETGQDVSLDVYGDESRIVWSQADGDLGHIEMAIIPYEGSACPHQFGLGCDMTASRADSALTLLCLMLIFIGLRRYGYQRA